MNKTPLMQVEGLFFGFNPNEPILKDVSFSLHTNEFIALIGPNGSGKSTLLKLLLRELMPNKGKILLNPDVRIAYVPQNLSFDARFPITALEVVLGGCFRLQNKKIAAERALQEVGMLPYKNATFGTLSGGQMQRVLIARAFVQKPTLLLLDEPTASVDTETENSILQILSSQKNRCATLMVTHNLKTILSAIDGIICLQQGMAYMKPKEVCEHFALGLYHEPLIEMDSDHFLDANQ